MTIRLQKTAPWSGLLAACLLLGSAEAPAQGLSETQWWETLSLDGDQTLSAPGNDPLNPEDRSGRLDGNNWSVDGSVTFGPPGPPHVTTRVNGSYQNGLNYLGGTAYVMISFEFRVNQIGTPPVTITNVPLTVIARGTADVSGDPEFFATAFAFLDLWAQTGPLVGLEARASNDPNDGNPTSHSFDVRAPFSAPAGQVLSGSMAANAHISAEVPPNGIEASAQAFIDPIIEVIDELIPGTSTRYRDVFEVEMSEGYFALGDPTPVSRATWSAVKSIYAGKRLR